MVIGYSKTRRKYNSVGEAWKGEGGRLGGQVEAILTNAEVSAEADSTPRDPPRRRGERLLVMGTCLWV